MENILLIDKPKGITSFDVIRKLRRSMNIRKMGHGGTLDPLATGLMIIGVGAGTKLLTGYIGLDKTYETVIEFGKVSDTYDADGKVEEVKNVSQVSRDQVEEILKKDFTGEISQTPPIFSAIKVKGQRAYDLARSGKEVKLEPRKVTIKNIEILKWEWPLVTLKIDCSKGTYIRSIAHDLGQKLGCGGYVKELRRTRIGDFKVEDATVI
ncbi:MAG: tRNA pseudouridine(55) synthase TruB [Candidatus Gracilibacteria bacterium]